MHAWNRCLLKRANCSRLKSLSVGLDNLKASIVTTIEIILIIERFNKLDNVAHFFFCRLLFILSSTQNLWFYVIFFHKNYFGQSYLVISLFEKLLT